MGLTMRSESEFMLLNVRDSRHQRNEFWLRVLVMGLAVVLVFITVCLIISGETPAIKRPQFVHKCSHNYTFDFNLMTLRWPTSECEDNDNNNNGQKCLPYVSDKWLIHGLWPTYASEGWPEFCCTNQTFDEKYLEPIKGRLLTDWPNLIPGQTEDSLWRHEWTKHGTCTLDREVVYFNNTLTLLNSFPAYEWLKESHILPANDKTYDVKDFEKVFNDKLGHKVVFNCVKRKHNATEHVINEIRICINHTTDQQVIDCPEKSSCDQKFFYPMK